MLTVDVSSPENAKLKYCGYDPLPTGCRCLGEVTRSGGYAGALIENHFGMLSQVSHGLSQVLSQSEARTAFQEAVRRFSMRKDSPSETHPIQTEIPLYRQKRQLAAGRRRGSALADKKVREAVRLIEQGHPVKVVAELCEVAIPTLCKHPAVRESLDSRTIMIRERVCQFCGLPFLKEDAATGATCGCARPGSILRKHRVRAGLSKRALAERLGVSYNLLNGMESERNPIKLETALRLGELFGVDFKSLIEAAGARLTSRKAFFTEEEIGKAVEMIEQGMRTVDVAKEFNRSAATLASIPVIKDALHRRRNKPEIECPRCGRLLPKRQFRRIRKGGDMRVPLCLECENVKSSRRSKVLQVTIENGTARGRASLPGRRSILLDAEDIPLLAGEIHVESDTKCHIMNFSIVDLARRILKLSSNKRARFLNKNNLDFRKVNLKAAP